jgi:hypothetical protein
VTALRYSVLRLLLLLGVLCVLWLVGLRGALLLVVTLVVSVPLSYVVLRGPREAMTQQVAERMARRMQEPGPDVDTAAEDAEADAVRRAAADDAAGGSADPEADREQDAVGELGAPGVAEDGDEGQAARPAADDAQRRPRDDG